MEDRHISLPEQKNFEQAYQLSYQLACEKLSGISDIAEQCRKSGTQFQIVAGKKTVIIKYLNQPFTLSVPDGEITPMSDAADPLTPRDKLIMLHYFITAKGSPLAGKPLTFRELPEGIVYQPTFAKRTIQPLLDNFGKEPDTLLLFSQSLGGYKADYGDTAITINAFSRVPITFVVWQGDDEFPSRGNVLFDASITDYLPTEDITVLCEIIAWKLVRYSRAA
ncbi:MAG: hypothetical protein A2Z28_07560 [Chloroflexi bacterium RBG_16_51_9]|nr:MAG: hypothetical protein A2Z28_07560 [Chloroflexi bacterium RBG_16_51_9]